MSSGETRSGDKSLIIGAAGQVGHQIALALGAENTIRTSRTPPDSDWVAFDLEQAAQQPALARQLIAGRALDAVYCVGGATNVDRCEQEPGWSMRTNCEGPALLAALCRDIPFIYFSTEYIFDGAAGPYSETAAPNPISEYGRSKWLAEQAIQAAHPTPLILRTTVVYGKDAVQKNFLYALRRALQAGNKMRVPNDQISTPTYNCDLARAAVELVNAGQSGVFHVCGPDLLSRYDFAVTAAQLMNLDATQIVGVPTSELRQIAPRPLQGGLLTAKLANTLPHVKMRPVKEAITHWLKP